MTKTPNYFNNLGLALFYGDEPAAARENYERALRPVFVSPIE